MSRATLYPHPVCDFCSNAEPTWRFPAKDVMDHFLQTESTGAWLACEICALCIRRGEWKRLAERCLMAPGIADEVIPNMGRDAALAQASRSIKMFRSVMRPGDRIGVRKVMCDFCVTETDRCWLWKVRGAGYTLRNGKPLNMEFRPGAWGACVFCRPLFERGEIDVLIARVVTLNPMLDARDLRPLYEALILAREGEPLLWETGMPLTSEIFERQK